MHFRPPHRVARLLLACSAALAVATTPSMAGAYTITTRIMASASASITVDTTHSGSAIPSTAVGLNTGVWDSHLQDAATPSLVQGAGVNMLRFPGGSTSDVYHWQTNSITSGQSGYANPANTFDNFMQNVVAKSGAQPIITVNYGSNASGTAGGDPNEAAAWVRYANITQHYGVKYWEIGNEVYGNGYYGAQWETDLHADHSPAAYATNALAYIQAMKAVDPTIKVGLVLCAPGAWPDGQGPQSWNNTVLSIAGSAADFVIIHWYAQSPWQETDSGLLGSTSAISGMVSNLRSELASQLGAHGQSMQVMVTETNSVSSAPGKQTTSPVNALFLMDDYLSWLQAGVNNVTWWDLREGPQTNNNNSSSLAGSTTYGDYGVLSSGTGPEPPANTPFPAYAALQLLKQAIPAGAAFLNVASTVPDVHTFALQRPDGTISLVLINTNATTAFGIQPSFNGITIGSVTSSSFTFSDPQVSSTPVQVSNGTFTYTLAPYTAVVFSVTPGSSSTATSTPTSSPTSTATPAPATPTPGTTSTPAATQTPTSTATLSPTSTPSPTATAPSTPTPVSTATPTATLVSTVTPTPTATQAGGPSVLGNFEGVTDGFTGNSAIAAAGPSTWSPTVALGSSSLWTRYSISSPWNEAQLYKNVNLNLQAFQMLSVSVYPKQPTVSGTGVKVRFLVQGSDGHWYASPYQQAPIGTRSTVTWNMSSVPRAPMKMIYVCWQFTTAAVSTGNEMWIDAVEAM